jgi:hypothetical protein
MDGVYMMVLLHYLTRDGETVCLLCALDDTPDMLHGMHAWAAVPGAAPAAMHADTVFVKGGWH